MSSQWASWECNGIHSPPPPTPPNNLNNQRFVQDCGIQGENARQSCGEKKHMVTTETTEGPWREGIATQSGLQAWRLTSRNQPCSTLPTLTALGMMEVQ